MVRMPTSQNITIYFLSRAQKIVHFYWHEIQGRHSIIHSLWDWFDPLATTEGRVRKELGLVITEPLSQNSLFIGLFSLFVHRHNFYTAEVPWDVFIFFFNPKTRLKIKMPTSRETTSPLNTAITRRLSLGWLFSLSLPAKALGYIKRGSPSLGIFTILHGTNGDRLILLCSH